MSKLSKNIAHVTHAGVPGAENTLRANRQEMVPTPFRVRVQLVSDKNMNNKWVRRLVFWVDNSHTKGSRFLDGLAAVPL